MNYDLTRMEPAAFEALSQSLFQGFLGPTCEIYGRGPDGQREAICHINNPLDIRGQQISGRTFLQAKYKGSQTKNSDLAWLKNELKSEFENLSEKKTTEPSYLPENYFFFTNVVLTPPKDIGIKDKIGKYVKGFKDIVPNIYVVGYDEICAMLDDNHDVRQAYYSFLVSGDIIYELYKWMTDSQSQLQKELSSALLRFVECEFKGDMYSRLEQAGDLNDIKIMLEKVFIDLEASPQGIAKKACEKFISHMVRVGNYPLNSFLEQSNVKNRFVLLGGAGQGKSTIGQYLAQIYRASLLKLDHTCAASDAAESFIKCFGDDYGYEIKCIRIPIRIILKDYAAWVKKNKNTGVLDYIVSQINKKASAQFEAERLREFLKTRSWVFIFDGLDEVPSSSNRAEVLEYISNFIDIELRRLNSDALILATTRQQGYNDDFAENKYMHLHLLEMNPKICQRYLSKLTAQIEPSIDEQKNIMAILTDALEDPVVSKLMRRPLHASIVTILVRGGGKPPRDKYALFKEYTDIIIRRERQKNIYKVLNEYESVVIAIHEEAAYILQEESSISGNPAAVFSEPDFISLIERKLSGCELENIKALEIINEIYDLAAFRLSYLSEVRDAELEFPIRSVQEYFAANFLIKHRPEEEITKIVRHIAPSGYWRNVLVFAVSYFIKEREHLEGTIDSICGELNGSTLDPDEYDIHKGAQSGAWLALDLLCENIFVNRPQIENKYIKHAANLLKLSYLSPSTGKIVTLPQNSLNKLIKSHLKPFAEQFPHSKSTWVILWHLIESRNSLAMELAENILGQPDANINTIFMYSHFNEHNMPENIVWLVPYIVRWLKKGNVFPSQKIFFFDSSAFIAEIKKNRKDRTFMSSFLRSSLLSMRTRFAFSSSMQHVFSYSGIQFNELYALLLGGENEPISEDISISFPLTELNQSQIKLLKSVNAVSVELNLVFFIKWSEFLLTSSIKTLMEMIFAYFEEEKSVRNQLIPYFDSFSVLQNVLSDCLKIEMSPENTRAYINDNFNTLFHASKEECMEMKKNINMLRERKHSNIYKYLGRRVSFGNTILLSFISDLNIKPLEISQYSVGFIELFIFVSVVACEARGMAALIENEECSKICRNVFDYYQTYKDAAPFGRMWFRQFTIYWLATLPASQIPDASFFQFQGKNLISRSYKDDNKINAVSIVLKNILKRVLLDEKEHGALKIIPIILGEANVDMKDTDIIELQNIKCNNAYNELGRLLICLFGNAKNTSCDFLELAKKLDVVYIADRVATVSSAHNLSTQAARNSIIALYSELKTKAKQNENADGAISKLEKAMYEISSNSVCTPINRTDILNDENIFRSLS